MEFSFYIELDWEVITEQYDEPNERDFAEWIFSMCRETHGDNINLKKLYDQFFVIQTTDETTANDFREVSWCYDTDGNTIANFVEVQLLPKDFSRSSILDWIGQNATLQPYGREGDLAGKDGDFEAVSPCANFRLHRIIETGKFKSSDLIGKDVKIGEVIYILNDFHLINHWNFRTNPTGWRPVEELNLHYIRLDFRCALSEYVVKQWFEDWSFDGRLRFKNTRGGCMDYLKVIDVTTGKVIGTH